MAALVQRVATGKCWADAGMPGAPVPAGLGLHDIWPISPAPPPADALLAGLVERDIVPRLVLAARAAPRPRATAPHGICTAEDAVELAERAMSPDGEAAMAFIDQLRARDVPLDSVYLDLLAPAARHLGWLWEEDETDFVHVTIGLGRLHQAIHLLSPEFQERAARRPHGHSALLVPVPGDQHTFGLAMVADFFRAGGWNVWSGVPASVTDLVAMVRRSSFAIIGFSASCGARMDALASTISLVRRASRNPTIGIMVGGPIFSEHPDLALRVGADATAVDGRQAALQAENLLALLSGQR